jgi:anti-sigma B factor antagonist
MSDLQLGLCLEREDFGDVTVLRIKATALHDDKSTRDLFEQASHLVESEGRSRLVLNFDGVGFMASAALGKLVQLMRMTASAGGKLTVCRLSRPLNELLRVSRLSDLLPSYADEQEALQALAAYTETSRDVVKDAGGVTGQSVSARPQKG